MFRNQVQAGEPLTVHGDETQTRDFVHIKDIVQANLRAGVTDVVGEPFNIGTGECVSIKELAEIMRAVADTSVEIVHEDPREGDIDNSEADISRAQEMLGYQPTRDLKEESATLFVGE